MGRWEPDARGRLARVALELYAERGFEQTTVEDIAERAGVTERTFFRHFADKREVLFDGSGALQERLVDAIASAPDGFPPIDVIGRAFVAVGALLEDRREQARRRSAVITANPALQERELLKLAALGASAAAALRARGVPPTSAALAAQAGVAAFSLGFELWVQDDSSDTLAATIDRALADLRAVTAGRTP